MRPFRWTPKDPFAPLRGCLPFLAGRDRWAGPKLRQKKSVKTTTRYVIIFRQSNQATVQDGDFRYPGIGRAKVSL